MRCNSSSLISTCKEKETAFEFDSPIPEVQRIAMMPSLLEFCIASLLSPKGSHNLTDARREDGELQNALVLVEVC